MCTSTLDAPLSSEGERAARAFPGCLAAQDALLRAQQGRTGFLEGALPILRRRYPACAEWAVALISGSLSFGRGDQYSDFDGRLYLPNEHYHRFGAALSGELAACGPSGRDWGFAVLNLDEPVPLCQLWRDPTDRAAWLDIDEGYLYYAVHWLIVHDPKGIAGAFQTNAAYYPDDVYPLRLRQAQVRLGQWRVCLERAVLRRDELTAHVTMGAVLDAAMRLGFLLGRQYGPWAKWMYEVFAALPHLGPELSPTIAAAARASDLKELASLAGAIARGLEPSWEGTAARVAGSKEPGTGAEPPRLGNQQEHIAALWYALWEWTECNLHKVIARSQDVASYLYFTSSLLKVLCFGFYVLGQDWPPLSDLHRRFRDLPAPARDVVPALDEMMRTGRWPDRLALMRRVLTVYREYMRQQRLLPERCLDDPAWTWAWLGGPQRGD